MKQWWSEFPSHRKKALLVLGLSIVVLTAFVYVATRPGFWHQQSFFYEKDDGVWQGKVRGEQLTVSVDGRELQVSCDGAERIYRIEGDAGFENEIVLYQDEQEVFRGSYFEGLLRDKDGNIYFNLEITFSTGDGQVYVSQEDGSAVPQDPMDLGYGQVMDLLLGTEQETRGYWPAVFYVAVLLIVALVDLWWPKLNFQLLQHRHQFSVHRNIMDDEPSDWYYVRQTISRVVLYIAAGIILAVAFGQ